MINSPLNIIARWMRARGIRRNNVTVERVLKAANRHIRKRRFCTVITNGVDGIQARVVQQFPPKDDNFVIRFGTSLVSRKARQIEETGQAVLVYEDDRRGLCVTVYCHAAINKNLDARKRWFVPIFAAYWPEGPSSPDFVVIECCPYVIEVWDYRSGLTPLPFGLKSARIELRDEKWFVASD